MAHTAKPGVMSARTLQVARTRLGRILPTFVRRYQVKANTNFLKISEEVREALHSKKPVVALETTIYTHGFPYPENVALASHLESVVRVNGGVPATIGILDGIARAGFDPEELIRLAASAGKPSTLKLSRRDLSYVCGLRLTSRYFNGGTTIAGTMILAHLAGIKIFSTGGLGGVHRGAESSMDISADLTELGRTPVAVISSGCKSFLDIPKTLEYLETQGVGVATFADGSADEVDFPAFWSRESGVKSPMVVQNEAEAGAIIYTQGILGLTSGLLFANPIPEEASIPKSEMDIIIDKAIHDAEASGVSGKNNTPFILSRINRLSEGRSIAANRALIESNVRRGVVVAKELVKLEQCEASESRGTSGMFPALHSLNAPKTAAVTPIHKAPSMKAEIKSGVSSLRLDHTDPLAGSSVELNRLSTISKHDVLVAGSLAVDYSCNFAPLTPAPDGVQAVSPQLYTSNPAIITQTLGGVGYNVARTINSLGCSALLASMVGDDVGGRAALAQAASEGLDTSAIVMESNNVATAQYVAVNDAHKNLVVGMADMRIMETPARTVEPILSQSQPRWVVVDGNWTSEAIHSWLQASHVTGALTAFEPVSAAKSTRLLSCSGTLSIWPRPTVHLATPNVHELTALHSTASHIGLFDREDWWKVINSLGIPSVGARDPLTLVTSASLVDAGVPQRAIQLLPFIPTIITKLGGDGVLMISLLSSDDPRLSDSSCAPYILSQGKHPIGGLYVRLFPPHKRLGEGDVVSVNGAGDTLLGALIVELVNGKRVDQALPFAIKAAELLIQGKNAISDELALLRAEV